MKLIFEGILYASFYISKFPSCLQGQNFESSLARPQWNQCSENNRKSVCIILLHIISQLIHRLWNRFSVVYYGCTARYTDRYKDPTNVSEKYRNWSGETRWSIQTNSSSTDGLRGNTSLGIDADEPLFLGSYLLLYEEQCTRSNERILIVRCVKVVYVYIYINVRVRTYDWYKYNRACVDSHSTFQLQRN